MTRSAARNASIVAASMRLDLMLASRVIEVLSQPISTHGAPKVLRSDNGPEFVYGALLKAVIEQCRQHYNQVRAHSTLGNETPEAFRIKCRSGTQPEAILQE